jgi:SAM-dependent methyltransferase
MRRCGVRTADFANLTPSPRPSADHFRRVQETALWRRLHADLLDLLPPGNGRSALDLGCGPGLFARMLHDAGYQVVGVDRELDMVDAARAAVADKPGMSFRTGDAERLDLPSDAFDVVVMTNLLFFLADPLIAVREMDRVCRPGGLVAVLNPAPALDLTAAARIAEEAPVPDDERWVMFNWARLAEVNGTIDQELWQTVALLADLQPTAWVTVGVSGIGAVGCARRPREEPSDER